MKKLTIIAAALTFLPFSTSHGENEYIVVSVVLLAYGAYHCYYNANSNNIPLQQSSLSQDGSDTQPTNNPQDLSTKTSTPISKNNNTQLGKSLQELGTSIKDTRKAVLELKEGINEFNPIFNNNTIPKQPTIEHKITTKLTFFEELKKTNIAKIFKKNLDLLKS